MVNILEMDIWVMDEKEAKAELDKPHPFFKGLVCVSVVREVWGGEVRYRVHYAPPEAKEDDGDAMER